MAHQKPLAKKMPEKKASEKKVLEEKAFGMKGPEKKGLKKKELEKKALGKKPSEKKALEKKKTTPKRIVVEIAPGIQKLLGGYILGYNKNPDRVSPPLKLTDVVNQALDAYLGKPKGL